MATSPSTTIELKKREIFEKYRVFGYICVLFEVTGILTTVSYVHHTPNLIQYDNNRLSVNDNDQNILLYLMLANSLALMGAIFLKNFYYYKYMVSIKSANSGSGIANSNTSISSFLNLVS